MANIQSNIKRNTQSKNRNVLVHSQNSTMKTFIKKAKNSKNKNDIANAYSYIDSCLSKGVIKKNKADRLKSRLMANINQQQFAPVKTETPKKTKKSVSKTTKKTKSK